MPQIFLKYQRTKNVLDMYFFYWNILSLIHLGKEYKKYTT